MRRGEIWTLSGGLDYAAKPRPAVLLQDDSFTPEIDSVTVCLFTKNTAEAPLFRPEVNATVINGLYSNCRLMVDKIMTVPKKKLGYRIGRLSDEDMLRLARSLMVFLGLASSK